MPSVFFSYSHADETLRDELEKQLSMLKRQGVIETWHDRRIGAGEEIDRAIDERLNGDDIILLLVSPDFIASRYCYDVEMKRAMERHQAGEAIVIPVILRPCDWQPAPFGKLNASPPDGKPITKWTDRDEAFLEVAKAVRKAAERFAFGSRAPQPAQARPASVAPEPQPVAGPRSSNLRLAKTFTEREKDRFKQETFEFVARFFENSLGELGKRNPGIEGDFRRVDANRFTAAIYKDGKAKARCTVFLGGGGFASGINYVDGETSSSNSINETLRVEADDQAMFLQSMGMAMVRRGNGAEQKLSQEGAAELYWDMLIAPLQQRW